MRLNAVLVANRGEIAVRLIGAIKLYGAQAIAIFSDAEPNAPHVRLADAAYPVGAPPSAESYLQGGRIIEVAREAGCDAIHPGYGFLSENADFAAAVRAAGLVFIGPPTEAIRQMGDKTTARALMSAAGVPVLPGAEGPPEALTAAAARMGYPLLVKAAAGGGGKGMRLVQTAADLPVALESAAREAEQAFGDPRLYIERYIPQARHIEIQILGDQYGHLVHFFERECSIQRRHQKIIEEAPAPHLNADLRARLSEAALGAARAVGYHNAGTVEFILDAESDQFYFLEMNTRLQVEHPVTECITGHDLALWQIRLAAGERLTVHQADLSTQGHAIECRLYAEDPAAGFLPSTGPVLLHEAPRLPGVRVDTGIASGDRITPYYDPLLAKVIACGATREEARARLVLALRDYPVLGVTTNVAFLLDVLAHPAFIAGDTLTDFIARYFDAWQPAPPPDDLRQIAAIMAALGPGRGAPSARPSTSTSPWEEADNFRLGAG
ncbi:MAG: acetyl/propionyl/methylcrotonyl-CoA carboxylase subunit alpha [Anaerolineales bacterium]